MNALVFGLRLLASMAVTLFARLSNGPARPTWSFLFEAIVRTLQKTGVRIGRLTPVAQRAAWAANTQPNPFAKKVRITDAAGAPVPSRWVVPTGVADAAPVIVYFHGGAYRYGAFDSHAELVCRLAVGAGAKLLFVDYRLCPEHPFPAGIDDATRAARWVLQTVPATRVVFAGDSAGGGLSMAVLQALRAAGEALPAGAVLLCPWVDLTARGGSLTANAKWDWALPEHFIDWATTYATEAEWKDPRASPTFADFAGLPPMLIQVGGAEMLYDQVVAFAAKAKAAGVDARLTVEPDMVHDWQILAQVSQVARRSIDEATAFVRDVTR